MFTLSRDMCYYDLYKILKRKVCWLNVSKRKKMIIDSHAHLNDEKYLNGNINYKEIINNMKSDGLKKIITVSYDLKSMQDNVKIANENIDVYCALGIHPENCKDYTKEAEKFIISNAINNKVVAIGEIGLDYHYEDTDKTMQNQILISQIKLAHTLKLPLIFHIRDAMGDMLEILKDNKEYLDYGFVAHCYSGSVESAKILLDMGGYISFAGPLTFKNSKQAIEVVKFVPLDRILVETDSPYLAPEPFRGTLNQPKNTLFVANKIAEILNIDKEKVYVQTVLNSYNLFKKLH